MQKESNVKIVVKVTNNIVTFLICEMAYGDIKDASTVDSIIKLKSC